MSATLIGTTRGSFSPIFGPQPYHLSFTLGTPADGNTLIAVFVSMPSSFANPWSTGPSGWTLVTQGTAAPGGNSADQTYRYEIWRRTAASDTGATYTWTWTNTGGPGPAVGNSGADLPAWGDVIEWSGLSTSASWAVASSMSTSTSGPVEHYATAITSANPTDIVFNAFWPAGDVSDSWSNTTLPSGYTSFRSASGLMAFYKAASSSGAQTGEATNSTHTNFSDVEQQPIMGLTMPQGGSVGSSAGTSTVAATGIAKKPAVGAAAGVAAPTGVGKANTAGVGTAAGTASVAGSSNNAASKGTGAGTSTATGVGSASIGSAGSAQGGATVTGVTGLRQAVGLAQGTSAVVYNDPQPILAPVTSRVDHVQRAIDRLCQYAKEKRSVQ